jgi:hypothetical protein
VNIALLGAVDRQHAASVTLVLELRAISCQTTRTWHDDERMVKGRKAFHPVRSSREVFGEKERDEVGIPHPSSRIGLTPHEAGKSLPRGANWRFRLRLDVPATAGNPSDS